MKISSFFKLSPVFLFSLLSLAETASAQFTWNPAPVNGNWNNPDNWQQWPLLGAQDRTLTFGASTVTAINNDFAGSFALNSLAFTNAAPGLTISSSSNSGLHFQGQEAGQQAFLVKDTNADVMLNLPVSLLSDLKVTGTGTGNLTFAGTFFAGVDQDLIMEAAGTLTFGGSVNTLAGSLIVNSGTISVTDGHTFTSATGNESYLALIGEKTGSNGTVNIGGGIGSSVWNNSSAAIVSGYLGTGALNITGGGSVTGGSGSIGEYGTGNGTVSVGGGTGGSSWSNTGNLLVGNRGTGGLTLTGGGAVDNAVGIIGNVAGSMGTASVGGGTGTSVWTNRAHLVVGQDGGGSLDVTGGGSVTNTTGYIGYGATSTGEVTVGGGTGASSWSNSGDLNVGTYGDGNLTLTGGGTVSTTGITYVADKGGSTGTVLVGGGSGTSTWTNSDLLYVGVVGTGSMTVTGGGVVSSRVGIIGDGTGGGGTVTVDGTAGSAAWNNTTHLVVGQWGTADLTVTGGGTVTNTAGFIAYDVGSVGTVTIGGGSGTSSWINSGALSVGYSGNATLNINSGGVVEAASLDDGNSESSIRFDGGTLRITGNDTASNRIVLGAGGGTLENAGNVTYSGPLGGAGRFTKAGAGTLTMNVANQSYGGGTTVKGGTLAVTATGAAGTGEIVVESGRLNVSSGIGFSNKVVLSGGTYQRTFNTGVNPGGQFTVGSHFEGGTADATARLLAYTTTPFATQLRAEYFATTAAVNDAMRISDAYDLFGVPADLSTFGSTVPIALELSYAGTDPAAFLAWLNPSTNAWENAYLGNRNNNNPTFTGSPYAGSFAAFQAQNGTDLYDYMGAWGVYTDNGTTYTWSVVNHDGTFAVIPEPASALLAAFGAGVLTLRRRRPSH